MVMTSLLPDTQNFEHLDVGGGTHPERPAMVVAGGGMTAENLTKLGKELDTNADLDVNAVVRQRGEAAVAHEGKIVPVQELPPNPNH